MDPEQQGYNNNVPLAGDSRNTRHMLYPGSIMTFLHSTTSATLKIILGSYS